jgi:G3E family GTPase
VPVLDTLTRPEAGIDAGDMPAGHGFETMILSAPHPVRRHEMDRLLRAMPDGILRLKGFLLDAEAPGKLMLLQGVGRRWTWHDAPDAPGIGKLVVVGQTAKLNDDSVQRHFAPLGLKRDAAGH